MAKRLDPRAKARRQKIVAGVLGVVLLGVLVFQAPTILGAFGGSSEPASEPAPVAAPAPVPASPAAPPAAAGTATLIDSDPAPELAVGQLISFDRFESKDPFVQQVGNRPAAGNQGGADRAGNVAADPGRKAARPEGTVEPSPGPAQQAPAAPAGSPVGAKISVNGLEVDVPVGKTFPPGDDYFKLVSATATTAKIGIAGGSYANGAQTVTLKKGGKPVTLMNTADGTTYVLRYLAPIGG